MNLLKRKQSLINEINNLKKELEKIENEINEKKNICTHKEVYKYIFKKPMLPIYECKKCRIKIEEKELKNKKILVRSFI